MQAARRGCSRWNVGLHGTSTRGEGRVCSRRSYGAFDFLPFLTVSSRAPLASGPQLGGITLTTFHDLPYLPSLQHF